MQLVAQVDELVLLRLLLARLRCPGLGLLPDVEVVELEPRELEAQFRPGDERFGLLLQVTEEVAGIPARDELDLKALESGLPQPIVDPEGEDRDIAGRGVDAHRQPAPGPHHAFYQPRLSRTETAQDADANRRFGVPADLFEIGHEVGDATALALVVPSIEEPSKLRGQVQTFLADLSELHGEPPRRAKLRPRVCLESSFIRGRGRNIWAWTTNIAVLAGSDNKSDPLIVLPQARPRQTESIRDPGLSIRALNRCPLLNDSATRIDSELIGEVVAALGPPASYGQGCRPSFTTPISSPPGI